MKTIHVYTWGGEYHHIVVQNTYGVLPTSKRWDFANSAYHPRLARLHFLRNSIEAELFEGGKYTDGSYLPRLSKKINEDIRDSIIKALQKITKADILPIHIRSRNARDADTHDVEGTVLLTLVNGDGYGESGVFVQPVE